MLISKYAENLKFPIFDVLLCKVFCIKKFKNRDVYMKKFLNKSVLFFMFLLGLASCGIESKIDNVADEFYENLNEKNYKAAAALADTTAFDSFSKAEFMQWLEDRNEYWGRIKSYKRYLTNVSETDSITLARFNYMVISERDTVYEFLEFIAKGDDIKIISYGFSPEKEDVTPTEESDSK